MNDFFTQVTSCLEQQQPVVVKGFGFNATDLGVLKSEEDGIKQVISERAPEFLKRLTLEKRFHRQQMAKVRREKNNVRVPLIYYALDGKAKESRRRGINRSWKSRN